MKLTIDWSKVPNKFNWAAMDQEGTIWLYSSTPIAEENRFMPASLDESGEKYSLANPHWHDTLTERPAEQVSEGWIEWLENPTTFEKCPVDEDVSVEVRYRNGETYIDTAGNFYWGRCRVAYEHEIVAYRIVKPEVDEQVDEQVDAIVEPKPANINQHRHLDIATEWMQDTTRTILEDRRDGEGYCIRSFPTWNPAYDYKFPDHVEQQISSPLSPEEMADIVHKNVLKSMHEINEAIAIAAKIATLNDVAELVNEQILSDADIVKLYSQNGRPVMELSDWKLSESIQAATVCQIQKLLTYR